MFHLYIFDVFYNKKLIKYLLSLDGDVVLAYCSMPVPERDFMYEAFYKVHLSKLELMYHKSCVRDTRYFISTM